MRKDKVVKKNAHLILIVFPMSGVLVGVGTYFSLLSEDWIRILVAWVIGWTLVSLGYLVLLGWELYLSDRQEENEAKRQLERDLADKALVERKSLQRSALERPPAPASTVGDLSTLLKLPDLFKEEVVEKFENEKLVSRTKKEVPKVIQDLIISWFEKKNTTNG